MSSFSFFCLHNIKEFTETDLAKKEKEIEAEI